MSAKHTHTHTYTHTHTHKHTSTQHTAHTTQHTTQLTVEGNTPFFEQTQPFTRAHRHTHTSWNRESPETPAGSDSLPWPSAARQDKVSEIQRKPMKERMTRQSKRRRWAPQTQIRKSGAILEIKQRISMRMRAGLIYSLFLAVVCRQQQARVDERPGF